MITCYKQEIFAIFAPFMVKGSIFNVPFLKSKFQNLIGSGTNIDSGI